MKNIEEVKKRLPREALEQFEKIFSQSEYNKLLLAFRHKGHTTFRINSLKTTGSEIIREMQQNKFHYHNIAFIPQAFLVSEKANKILNSPLVKEGKIYLQSISSMLPPLILNPQKDQTILDIAAAPGSKTSQLAAMMNNTGHITAVEPDFIRLQKLKHNLEHLGVTNVHVVADYGENIHKLDQKFDKVLADLPCSGEGRFNIYDRASYSQWRPNIVPKLARLQKKILKSAILTTKIGGEIVYSTCTLNIEENEKVVQSMLMNTDFQIEIMNIAPRFMDLAEQIPAVLQWEGQTFSPEIKKALRLIPSERLEGFFICKMKRTG